VATAMANRARMAGSFECSSCTHFPAGRINPR